MSPLCLWLPWSGLCALSELFSTGLPHTFVLQVRVDKKCGCAQDPILRTAGHSPPQADVLARTRAAGWLLRLAGDGSVVTALRNETLCL